MASVLVIALPFIISLLTVLPPHCDAHGRLMDPPARNSMWRLGFNNPVNYNDNELYCGGRMVQWLRNSGKCGVCGDPFHGKNDHEAGGKYANGIITRSFHEGDVMPVTVHLTANHLGWFEFRVCPVNDPKKKVTQKCLDKYQLKRADGKGDKYFVPKGKYNAFFNYTLQLPEGLTCKQCVIQWKYRTGNTWDKDDKSGLFCLGCGPQEEFYNCADIEILPKGQKSKWTKEQNMRPTTTTAAPGTQKKVMKKEKTKKPVNPVGESKHDKDKNNAIDKYDHKTTQPASASKPTSPRAVTKGKAKDHAKNGPKNHSNDHSEQKPKRLPKNHPKGNAIVDNQNSQKNKPKHPQDVKYNWRASTPWLLRRKYFNRRRLNIKHKHRKTTQQSPNDIDKDQKKPNPDPKVQNEPDAKKTPASKPTTIAPVTRKPTTRKLEKQTSPTAAKTTRQQYKTSPKPQRVTKMRTTVTKAPKTHIIKGPSKSWLIASRKRQQSPFKKITQPVKQTTRPVGMRTARPTGRKHTSAPRPVVKKSKTEETLLTKTTAHNCVTETPENKPLKQVLKSTAKPRQDDTQSQSQRVKFVTPKHEYTKQSTETEPTRFQKPTTGHSQRVISYQPVVREPMIEHQQSVVDPRQHMVDHQQPVVDHRQPLAEQRQLLPPSQGQYGINQNPISGMWWNQYQQPVNYFWNRPRVTPLLKCRATITLGGGMDEWCTANCNANFCPGGMCICQPDHQQNYPSYSMYPPQTQSWGNTYSPALTQYNTEGHVSAPSQSLSPFAPRRHTIPRQRTIRKLSPVHQVRRQKQYRPARQPIHGSSPDRQQIRGSTPARQQIHGSTPARHQIRPSSPAQTSRSIFSPSSAHSPANSSPVRDHNSVWAQKGKYYCRATGRYAGLKRFDDWCSKNCMNVICPLLICECSSL